MSNEILNGKTIHAGGKLPKCDVTNASSHDNFSGVMDSDKALGERPSPYPGPALCPTPEVQHEEIFEHLERILSDPLFSNSRRYASVLRYIVERTLQGNEAQLKERIIGIEVFHRTPDYDTANDHVVRSAMSEVRRRLAQYYREGGSESEVRIGLQPGSYVPHFSRVTNGSELNIASAGTALSTQGEVLPLLTSPAKTRFRRRTMLLATVALVAAVAVLLFGEYSNDPMQAFWAPVLAARGPVLLCMGTLRQGLESAGGSDTNKSPVTLADFHSADTQLVQISDTITVAELAQFLGQEKKACHMASQSEANFGDLQNGPTVLVGLMNNDWTERLISNLRFTVGQDSQRRFLMIHDRNNPANRSWTIDYSAPYLEITNDYALILRMKDPKTDQVVVVAAGLSVFGTSAAGRFLTDPDDMKKLAAIAPRGWANKNMELVLSTDVIRGTAGHGTIVASQFW